MVLHCGISCYKQKLSIYNTDLKEQTEFDIQYVGPNDFNGVEQMFFTIMQYFNGGQLECLCICLGSNYNSEIRKQFIRSGKNVGFTKVFITDWLSSMYSNLVSQTNFKLQKGDFILIFCGQSCYLWQKGFKKAKFVKEIKYYDTVESLFGIKKAVNKEPALIIYGIKYRTNPSILKSVFSNSKIHLYNYLNQVNGAVVKARIMAADQSVMEYDTQALLERDVTIKIGSKTKMEIKKWHPLPLFREQNVYGSTLVTITSHLNTTQKQLPQSARSNITLEIDTDGISLVAINAINNKNQKPVYQQLDQSNPNSTSIPIFESNYNKDISFFISKQFRKHYFLPKLIQNNHDSIFAVGIDLGTSRCCAAVNCRSGIETVPLDNMGERLLPSYIAFDEENEKCGQIVINRLPYYSKATVFDVKRIIGKRFSDIKMDENWAFKILNSNNDKVKIQIESQNGFTTKTSEEITAVLLKNIKQKVEAFQGKQLSKVIITVPAAYNSYQIKSTYIAAKLAGWQHIKLLPEPVAAAFAYYINRPFPQASTLLLFDLGGGTLDVCIFKVVYDKIQIISRAGNCNLGGRDFDNILINYCKEKLKADYKIVVPETKKYKLMLKCQEIKHNLTMVPKEQIDVEEFELTKQGFIEVTREQFVSLSSNLLKNINDVLSSALKDIRFKAGQIDKVLQVGGGCRMPMIKKLLQDKFPEAGHCCEEHPEEVVAVGAAYFSYYLNLNQLQRTNTSVQNIPKATKFQHQKHQQQTSNFKNYFPKDRYHH